MGELQRNNRARRFNLESASQPLTHIEDLAVRLDVARGMQKQYGYWDVVRRGEEREIEILASVLDICRTDPAHKRVAAAHTEPQAELPKAVSWDEAMQGRERDFNRRYYNNSDGEPKFPHEV